MPSTPVRVISLKGSADRRAWINAALHRAGLEFEFFDAVNAYDFNGNYPKIINLKNYESHFGYTLKPGEAGCALSHISLWREMIEKNIPALLILEDDVFYHADFDATEAVDFCTNHMGEKVEVMLLSWNGFSWPRKKTALRPGYEIRYAIKEAYLTSAYLITRNGAKALLDHIESTGGLSHPIDFWLMNGQPSFSKICAIKLVNPPLFYQTETMPSSIREGTHRSSDLPVKKKRKIRDLPRNLSRFIRIFFSTPKHL